MAIRNAMPAADALPKAEQPFATHHRQRRQGQRLRGFRAHGARNQRHAAHSITVVAKKISVRRIFVVSLLPIVPCIALLRLISKLVRSKRSLPE
jgi:hypothetical protein